MHRLKSANQDKIKARSQPIMEEKGQESANQSKGQAGSQPFRTNNWVFFLSAIMGIKIILIVFIF